MNKYPARVRGVAAVAVIALMGLGASAASAQLTTDRRNTDTRETSVAPADSEAAQYRARALALYSSGPAEWSRVADLHAKAARAASFDDPGRVEDLWAAGALYASLHRPDLAQQYLTQAAEAAMEFGKLIKAGESYIAAAVAAAQNGDRTEAHHLAAHAGMIAQSELLPEEMCDCLLTRVAMLTASRR